MSGKSMIMQKLGGAYQLAIRDAEDLDFILDLPDAHWLATDVPCVSLTCDKQLLTYLDTDQQGSIRSDELKQELAWLLKQLKDRSGITSHSDQLSLAALDTSHDEGKQLQQAAQLVLRNLKKSETDLLSLDDVRNRKLVVSAENFNGDGVVPAVILKDEQLLVLHQDVLKTGDAVKDISGADGINEAALDRFLGDARDYLAWLEQGKMPETAGSGSTVFPRGEQTEACYNIIETLRAKLDEFFALCRLVKVDCRCETRFKLSEEDIDKLEIHDPAALNEVVKGLPLARPAGDETLFLLQEVNPEYQQCVEQFQQTVLDGRSTLTVAEWDTLKAEFASFGQWRDHKKGAAVESIGRDTLQQYLDSDLPEKLRQVIKDDLEVADELKMVDSIEKLILYQRWFMSLVNNYVSLNELFDPTSPSMIQVGTLVMDGRHFDLSVKVYDRKRHKQIAQKANICVIYLNISRKKGDAVETMEVATGVTSGFMTHLFVGKRGVFFTPDKLEWHAEIIDILQQPVSLAEAMCRPFVKLGEFIGRQIEKFTSSRYKQVETNLDKRFAEAEKAVSAPAKEKPAASGSPFVGGSLLLLGGGVSLAAFSSGFAFVVGMLKDVSLIQILKVMLIIALIIALPIFIAAVLKLRKRNLGIFLEANGWAVNAPLRLTSKMALIFTHVPKLPKQAKKRYFDLIYVLFRRIDIETGNRPLAVALLIVIIAATLGLGFVLKNRIAQMASDGACNRTTTEQGVVEK